MPIPKPNNGEAQDHFISRCMSNDTMGEDYPDNEQRLAICFQSWRDRNKREVNNLDKIKKVFNFDVKQLGTEEDRMLGFTGSTESEDRDGDIIEAFGWDLTDYLNNPVIMGFHEYDKFPYGKATKAYIDYNGKQLKFEVKFPTISELTSFPGHADMVSEHAKNVDMAYNMYKNGYMKAVSVGFIGKESEPRYDDEGNYCGKRYKKQALLELSLVPVPSNPTALMEARSKGIITDKELKQLEKANKSVIPYKKYPLADEGASWGGPREIASATVEQLKIMCTWYDSENAENKGAYKLPHHRADGNYTTVWRAVAAAMAALLGARGGVDIPENERRGVYNHLAKHYNDFDKEPPEFKSYTEAELKAMFPELKVGATISAKNRAMMEEAMGHMQMAMDMMKEMMMMPEEEGTHPMESAMRTASNHETTVKVEIPEEFTKSLDEVKYMLTLLTKDENDIEIDIDSIEFTPPKKEAATDELNIEPEELKNMIAQAIQQSISTIN